MAKAEQLKSIIIISGPAGVGKSTVAKALQKKYKNLKASITYTTRSPRPQAKEDKKIYYISKKDFEGRIKKNEFLEWALVHDNYYGTHYKKTLFLLKKYPVIFNIDVQGARQIMKKFAKNNISVFLMPESSEQMINHMKRRGHVEKNDIQNRLESAKKEIAASKYFNHIIINSEGKLPKTMAKIEKIILPYIAHGGRNPSANIDK